MVEAVAADAPPALECRQAVALPIAALSQLEGVDAGGESEKEQEGESAAHVGSACSLAPTALAGDGDGSTEYT